MRPQETYSHIRFRAAQIGAEPVKPMDVLFFMERLPEGFEDSGLCVGFDDFQDVQRELRIANEPLANLYHSLVLYFSQNYPNMHKQAEVHLRNNPRNHSSWNRASWTYSYFIVANTLRPYSAERVTPDFKIPNVGTIGRRVMRAVLFDDPDIDPGLTL